MYSMGDTQRDLRLEVLSHIIARGVFSCESGPWVAICKERGIKTHQIPLILIFYTRAHLF
jgi:hypothetical protein